MALNIKFDSTYYNSDSIDNGRIAKSFFKKMTRNFFNQSYQYWGRAFDLTGDYELPILFPERNLYSTIASSINKITPIHVSEWSFNPKDVKELDNSRRVDFWCLNREGENGKPINYYLEVKKGWYCLNKNSQEPFPSTVASGIIDLVNQTKEMKSITPKWADFDDVYMGISVIHGYFRNETVYSEKNVRDNIFSIIDKRTNAQLITSTWTLPTDMKIQWEKDQCKFITISGIILTKKRSI